MKKTVGIVFGVITVLVGLLLLSETRRQSESEVPDGYWARLGDTTTTGFILNTIVAEYRRQTGQLPTFEKFVLLESQVIGSWVKLERLSGEPGAKRVWPNLDGHGGWVYSANHSNVALNLTNSILVGDKKWVIPSDLVFLPLLGIRSESGAVVPITRFAIPKPIQLQLSNQVVDIVTKNITSNDSPANTIHP